MSHLLSLLLLLVASVMARIDRRQNIETLFPASAYGDCCAIVATRVALNVWYTGYVKVTVATVYTTLTSYSDTVVTAVSTSYNTVNTLPGGSSYNPYGLSLRATENLPFTVAGLPTNIITPQGAAGYGETVLSAATVVSGAGVLVPSPTPAMILPYLWVFYGSASGASCSFNPYSVNRYLAEILDNPGPTTNTAGFAYASLTFPVNAAHPSGNAQLVYTPPAGQDPTQNYTKVNSDVDAVLPLPPDVIGQLAAIPEIVSQVPDIAQCYPGILFGAPTAKVVVSELTASTTTTQFVYGYFSAPIIVTNPTVIATTTPEAVTQPTNAPSNTYVAPTGDALTTNVAPTTPSDTYVAPTSGTPTTYVAPTTAAASVATPVQVSPVNTFTGGAVPSIEQPSSAAVPSTADTSSPPGSRGTAAIQTASSPTPITAQSRTSIALSTSSRNSAAPTSASTAYGVRSMERTNDLLAAVCGMLWSLATGLI